MVAEAVHVEAAQVKPNVVSTRFWEHMAKKTKPVKPYLSLLESIKATHPHTSVALSKAEENRAARLSDYLDGIRLSGYEELLTYLTDIEQAFGQHRRLKTISFLIKRARADFVTALEGTLSGYHLVVHDAMRDVMELEFLLRDFTLHASHMEDWLTCSYDKRRTFYSAGTMRRRFAESLGIEPKDLPETTDYRGHSMSLHINPGRNLFAEVPGVMEAPFSFVGDSCFWEVFEHARRLVLQVDALARKRARKLPLPADARTGLPKVQKAWQQTQQMQTISLVMLGVEPRRKARSNPGLNLAAKTDVAASADGREAAAG